MNSINPVSPFNREMVTRYCGPAVRVVSVTAVVVIRPPLTVGTVPCVTAAEINSLPGDAIPQTGIVAADVRTTVTLKASPALQV